MATKIVQDKKRQASAVRFRLRSFAAAASCTAIVSLLGSTTPVAAAQEVPVNSADVLRNIDKAISGGVNSVPELAGAIADIQAQISNLDASIGAQREAVNRALVDLQDARTALKQARAGAENARADLDKAQEQVAQAQKKLNDLARSAYRRANTSESVTRAAGEDARSKMLERQSYLAVQTRKQRAVVEDLERIRTEEANKESQLRKVKQLAEEREERASQQEVEAKELLKDVSVKVSQAAQEREELLAKQAEVKQVLSSARGETQAAPEPQSPAPAEAPQTQPESEVEVTEPDQSLNGEVAATAPSDSDAAPAPEPAPTPESAPAPEPALAEADVSLSSQLVDPELGSSEDQKSMLRAGAAVFGVAAAVVAASQPEHTALVEDNNSGDVKALQNVLAFASNAMDSAAGGGAQNAEETSGLEDVLAPLQTIEDVTNEATQIVSGQGSDALVEAAVGRALSQVGTDYAWGGGDANGPTRGIRDGGVADSYGDFNKVGFDCSGLVTYAFAAAGISLPHYSGYQYNQGRKVSTSEIKRGDLLFYGPGGSQHVAIYLGDGTMVEAPQSGGRVQVVPVRYAGMTPHAVRLIG